VKTVPLPKSDNVAPAPDPFGDWSKVDAKLLAIFALGVLARIVWLIWRAGVIEPEGVYYARLGENLASGAGWIGIHAHGLQLFYPPLYPMLISTLYKINHNAEAAGQLVSLVFGSLFIFPIFFIGREMYSERVAYIAASLTALQPILVGFSATVYCESLYFFLLYTGICFGIRAARELSFRNGMVSGLLIGLAYLTRSEAMLIGCLAAGCIVLIGRRQILGSLKVAASIGLAITIVAAPYVVFLYSNTGQLRLEAKSSDNYAYGLMRLQGFTPEQAFRSLDDNLNPIGVTMKTDLENMREAHFSIGNTMRFIRVAARTNARELLVGLFRRFSAGGIPMAVLIAFGLLASPWNRRRLAVDGLVLLFVLCQFLPLLSLLIFNSRYVVGFIPALVFWVANGIERVAQWSYQKFPILFPALSAHRASLLATAALVIALLLPAWATTGSFVDLQRGDAALKSAGILVKNLFAGRKLVIMDSDGIVTYYAGATLRPFPFTAESTTFRYMVANGVNLVVIRQTLSTEIPYYRGWAAAGIADKRATLIATIPSIRYGNVLVYRWRADSLE